MLGLTTGRLGFSPLKKGGPGVAAVAAVTFTQEDVDKVTTGGAIALNFGASADYEKMVVALTGFISSGSPLLVTNNTNEGKTYHTQLFKYVDSTNDHNISWDAWLKPTGADVALALDSGTLDRAYVVGFKRATGIYDNEDVVSFHIGDSESPVSHAFDDDSFSWYTGGAEGTTSPLGLEGAGTIIEDLVRVDADNFWVECGYDHDTSAGSRNINVDNNAVTGRIHLATGTHTPGGGSGDIVLTFMDQKTDAIANVDPGVTISPTPVATEDYIVVFFGQFGTNTITTFDSQTPRLLATLIDGFEIIHFYHVTGVTAGSPAIVISGVTDFRNAVAVYKIENWDHTKFVSNGNNSEVSFDLYGQAGGVMIGAALSSQSNTSLGITGLTTDGGPASPEAGFWFLCASKVVSSTGDVTLTQDADGVQTDRASALAVSFGKYD